MCVVGLSVRGELLEVCVCLEVQSYGDGGKPQRSPRKLFAQMQTTCVTKSIDISLPPRRSSNLDDRPSRKSLSRAEPLEPVERPVGKWIEDVYVAHAALVDKRSRSQTGDRSPRSRNVPHVDGDAARMGASGGIQELSQAKALGVKHTVAAGYREASSPRAHRASPRNTGRFKLIMKDPCPPSHGHDDDSDVARWFIRHGELVLSVEPMPPALPTTPIQMNPYPMTPMNSMIDPLPPMQPRGRIQSRLSKRTETYAAVAARMPSFRTRRASLAEHVHGYSVVADEVLKSRRDAKRLEAIQKWRKLRSRPHAELMKAAQSYDDADTRYLNPQVLRALFSRNTFVEHGTPVKLLRARWLLSKCQGKADNSYRLQTRQEIEAADSNAFVSPMRMEWLLDEISLFANSVLAEATRNAMRFPGIVAFS